MSHPIDVPDRNSLAGQISQVIGRLDKMNNVSQGLRLPVHTYIPGRPEDPRTLLGITAHLNSLGLITPNDDNGSILASFYIYIAGTLHHYDPLVKPAHCILAADWNQDGYSLELLPRFIRSNGTTQYPA